MILDILIILIAVGVWCPRRAPWELLRRLAVLVLVVIWLARLLAPALGS